MDARLFPVDDRMLAEIPTRPVMARQDDTSTLSLRRERALGRVCGFAGAIGGLFTSMILVAVTLVVGGLMLPAWGVLLIFGGCGGLGGWIFGRRVLRS